MYLKTLDFKKYLGWLVKFADKKKLNPNNYLPIWSCTFSCGEQKAQKYWKDLQVFHVNLAEKQKVSALSMFDAWF